MAEDFGTPIVSRREISPSALGDLNFDIEELDDKEFNLPTIDTPPTLESILNETDDASLSDEEFSSTLGYFQETCETTSIDSIESHSRRERKLSTHKEKKSPLFKKHGSILRHVTLRGVSAQLQSAAERVNAGKPTSMAVSSVIAIGTFHGIVLIFDPQQVLKWCLGSTEYGEKYGSVSALAFNTDCSRLLAGYSRGEITMWDLHKGKLIRIISDAHPMQNAVLHIKFSDDPTLALCSDSGGSVFELNFKRVMGTRTCETRCIFSGSRGEVCALEPLRMTPHFRSHPSQEVCLVALGTVTKVIAVTVRPSLRVWFTHALRADPDTLPVLSWQFVVIQVSSTTRIIDPVLAFGRQSTIYFFQVNFASAEKINFIPLQKIELTYIFQNFAWLNSRTLVTLDVSEHLHVIDVKSDEELEILDLADVQLVYGTTHFKGLATGGNVSKAMAVAGERACYYSMAAFGSQLLLLGTKSIHVMTMRNWNERIEFLVKQKMFPEALSLALSFHDENAKAVSGLIGKKSQRKELVAIKILDILSTYVDLIMTQLCPERGRIEQLLHHYQEKVPTCVEYCIAVDKKDFLFGKMYENFQADPLALGVYLESLEPYILDGRLKSMTPQIVKEFVNYYNEKGRFEALEACIVRLNIENLDIHQVMTLCWEHGLYDAIIYVYNHGMNDYVTPFEELMVNLQKAVSRGKQLTDDQIRLGNKLLVYVSCCLAGRAYPWGDIPEDIVSDVKFKVFHCVTNLHGKNMEDTEIYPYLKTLLHFDTREFLNVLALAFEEPEFCTEMGLAQKQRVVDILLKIMVQNEGFLPTEIGALFTFLARQMAKQENSIMVNRLLFEQVLEHLTNPGDETRIEERQQALMELLQAGGLAQVNEERVLALAEKAKFYRVCEHLYEKHQQYDKILECYLQDPSRKLQVFYFIEKILNHPKRTNGEKKALEEKIISSIEQLIDIDNKRTSQVLLEFFPNQILTVVKTLNNMPELLYQFLQGLFSNKDLNSAAPTGNNKDAPMVDAIVVETYIDLMCQYNFHQVHTYLRRAEGYRLEETLEICRKHNAMEATAFLLERAGDIYGAFKIMLEGLQTKVKEITDQIFSASDDLNLEYLASWNELQSRLLVIIQLCQRNSNKMDQEEREKIWFPLLETMMAPQRQLRGRVDAKYVNEFKVLTRHLLNNMMGYISLPAILQRVVQDPAYNTGKFGEIRELIMGMFETYNYEKTLLSTTTKLLNDDLHSQLRNLCKSANHVYSSHDDVCSFCRNQLDAEEDIEIIIFRCGHVYHASCLGGSRQTNEGDVIAYSCIKCARHQRNVTRVLNSRIVVNKQNTMPSFKSRSKSTSFRESRLNSHQMQALEFLRKCQKTPKLSFIEELAQDESRRIQGSPVKKKELEDTITLNLAPACSENFESEF
ncbi:vacuolar protein sorting-associated protein 8 homolog [Nephila pilipes]|uniref:Vacuolar protein sorting-associated protein 8 homolog n=2 Tax=Nephila pilipes TaxID=299642 RepID=A0A8X6PT15_NEPPI|nr:vacuolar protein sorting-associated protein 8 homolog [Nephila pilipes]